MAPIEQLDQGLIAIMKAGKATPFQSRVDMLAPIVDRVLDMQYILRTSVGLGWSRLTPDQQSALLAAFRQYTIASYVDNFDSYDGQRFAGEPGGTGAWQWRSGGQHANHSEIRQRP